MSLYLFQTTLNTFGTSAVLNRPSEKSQGKEYDFSEKIETKRSVRPSKEGDGPVNNL